MPDIAQMSQIELGDFLEGMYDEWQYEHPDVEVDNPEEWKRRQLNGTENE